MKTIIRLSACLVNLWHTYKPLLFRTLKGLLVVYAVLIAFCLVATLLLKVCGVG